MYIIVDTLYFTKVKIVMNMKVLLKWHMHYSHTGYLSHVPAYTIW